ncbi:MAG: response regulator [Steroidobacteraceae bacterium]|nr:response regulator [Deltaproteobacteria bacterium]
MPLRLLVIEDSKADAQILVRELRKEGFDLEFIRVDTPKELQAALDGSSWDAVISDYNMPAFSGLDALQIIQSSGLDLPFILVTGTIGEEKAVAAMKAGAHDFILKGNFPRLAPALKRELREAEMRRERQQTLEDLRRAHEKLELRVQRRTAELEVVNEELQAQIDGRIRIENDLRGCAIRLIDTEENLKKKLATELHDEIGRDLTVLGINLVIIKDSLKNDAPENLLERVEDSGRLIEAISLTIRNIMAMLRPPVLDDYGLLAALRWHTGLFTKRTGIAVTIQADELIPRMMEEKEMAIFRIAQEALINVAKHAASREVTITIRIDNGLLRFTIIDDGKGFAPSSSTNIHDGSGLGLKIMRERAESIGGNFCLASAPGKGISITVEIPLEAE